MCPAFIQENICFSAQKKPSVQQKKKTAEDIYEIQYRMLERELIKQDKEITKLDLQIALLKKLNASPKSPTASQIFASFC